METETQPRVGIWYTGESDTGAFLLVCHDAASGVIHLRSADGRRVRMTLEKWSTKPLRPAQSLQRFERFEWYEPEIG